MVCSGLRPHTHGAGASGEREKVRRAKLPSSQWRNGGNRDSDGARHEGEACINPGLPTPTPKPSSAAALDRHQRQQRLLWLVLHTQAAAQAAAAVAAATTAGVVPKLRHWGWLSHRSGAGSWDPHRRRRRRSAGAGAAACGSARPVLRVDGEQHALCTRVLRCPCPPAPASASAAQIDVQRVRWCRGASASAFAGAGAGGCGGCG